MKDRIPKLNGKNNKLTAATMPATYEEFRQLMLSGFFADVFANNDGTGTDELGTPLNKGNLLADDTAGTLALNDSEATVNNAFRRCAPIASYLAFCTNANTNSLDAAFGKLNEGAIGGIGRQMAMYAWFKGASKTTFPFTKLTRQSTYLDCWANAAEEMITSPEIMNLINLSPYALNLFKTTVLINNLAVWKNNYSIMSKIVSTASIVDAIRTSAPAKAILHTNRATFTTIGSGTWVVPAGRTCVTAFIIAGGEGLTNTQYAGSHGAVQQVVRQVTPGQTISYTVGAAGGLSRLQFTASDIVTASGYANLAQSGYLLTKSGDGGAGSGTVGGSAGTAANELGTGGGGYGGNGVASGSSPNNGGGGLGGFGGGAGESGKSGDYSGGGGGGGYGGGGGASAYRGTNYQPRAAGGQGAIAIFMQ